MKLIFKISVQSIKENEILDVTLNIAAFYGKMHLTIKTIIFLELEKIINAINK